MRKPDKAEGLEKVEARTVLDEIRQRIAEVEKKARLDALGKQAQVMGRRPH